MRTRWLINLALLLVLGGLAIAIRLEVTRVTSPQTLAGLDPADLRQISVERSGEAKVRMERSADGWRLRQPMDTDAEQGQIDKLLEVLSAPVHRSFPEKAAAPAELGLEPPRIVLRLDGLTLSFGSLDPLTQRRYVGSDGLVHLIDERYYPPLIAPPLDYVSRAPATRGRPPVFGTLNGVPLAASSLKLLYGLRAERVETLAGETGGESLELKSADGTTLRFLVSEDRRRLSRLDLKLRYVLSDPLLLELDTTAVDPTPPAPPLPSEPLPSTQDASAPQPVSGFATEPGQSGAFAPPSDPDAPIPGDAQLGAPPAVRLSPDQVGGESEGGFGAEPYKQPPEGFGTDPFAPDPAYEPDANGDPTQDVGPEGR